MNVAEIEFALDADDGKQIAAFGWKGAKPPVALIQLAHGMGEHPLRYRRLAEALAQQGYAVYCNEHRGHGASAAAAGTLGDFGVAGFAALASDMATLSRHIKSQHPGLPLILVAHSMGSFAAQLYLLEYSGLLAGAALSGTAAVDCLASALMAGFRLEDMNAALPDVRTPFDWLSRDPLEVDRYIADPLCGFTVNDASMHSMFVECAKLADIDELRKIPQSLPLYLFSGDHDPVNNHLEWFHVLIQRLKQAGIIDLSYHVFGGARHETLNEINRFEVTAILSAWLRRILGIDSLLTSI